MNALNTLILNFFKNDKIKTFMIIILSCVLNILKINVISFITANIIKSIQNNDINNVYISFKYFIIVSVIFVLLFSYYKILQNYLLAKLRQWVRFYIIKMLLFMNNENLSEKNFTKLNTQTFRISNNCYYFFNNIFSSFIPNITLLLMVFLFFIYNNLLFGIIFLIGNIIIISYIYIYWNEMTEYHNIYEEGMIGNESNIIEILNNFDKIIHRGESNTEMNNLWVDLEEVIEKAYSFFKNNTKHEIILNIILFALLFILIYYLIILYTNKHINSTIFITFLTILLLYRDTILKSIQQIPEYVEYMGRSLMINTLLDVDVNEMENTKYKTHNISFDTIKFKNIKFKYKSHNKNILNNFSLDIIADNKILGITGSSGIGKSTIVKLLIKLYKYDGEILIDNINIKNIDTNYIRKSIIYVNQNSKLFDKKIIDNILYGCNDNTDKCHEQLSHIMKFKKINELYKNVDFNKHSGLSGENLSGGQRQVINLINGLIVPSKIVILDEPTNALDMNLKEDVIEIIKYFKQFKKCIIIISHDKDIYPIFDDVVKINN
jgi:ABC-type bacteriocin/lantibiotic exporter with double-glycine peptidase domain